jgi:hypothetical protein
MSKRHLKGVVDSLCIAAVTAAAILSPENSRGAGGACAGAGCGEGSRCQAAQGAVIWSHGRSLEPEASPDPTPESIGAFRAGLKLARTAGRQAEGRAALLREAGAIAVLPTASVFRVGLKALFVKLIGVLEAIPSGIRETAVAARHESQTVLLGPSRIGDRRVWDESAGRKNAHYRGRDRDVPHHLFLLLRSFKSRIGTRPGSG